MADYVRVLCYSDVNFYVHLRLVLRNTPDCMFISREKLPEQMQAYQDGELSYFDREIYALIANKTLRETDELSGMITLLDIEDLSRVCPVKPGRFTPRRP